jgi:hypothetical protein
VIKLFFVLKVTSLDLRKIARLFAQNHIKYKTMLRKLYIVINGLEVAHLVRKTAAVSQIQLLVPLDVDNGPLQLKLCAILNSEEDLEEQRGCEIRRREFQEIFLDVGHAPPPPDFQERVLFPPPLPSIASWVIGKSRDQLTI